MTVRVLTVHAGYGCRSSGACCTAGWPIPIEADRLAAIGAAIDDRRLSTRHATGLIWLRPADGDADALGTLEADEQGCVFFDSDGGRRCRIHHALGHDALPLACRQFPRVSVRDPRGVSVTLSHYCPTAAGLLTGAQDVAIIDDAPAFPAAAEYVGLDVRSGLPPLLRPDMLMDWAAWYLWEARAVGLLGDARLAPREALDRLASVVEAVRPWTPASGPLLERIDRAFTDAATAVAQARPPRVTPGRHLDLVLDAIPAGLRPGSLDHPGMPAPGVVRGFLAAHAFANWTAHLGEGLRAWLHSLETAWALLETGLGVRQADLLLRHLADPGALAAAFSRGERR